MTAPLDRPLRVALTVLGCKVNFAEMADLAGRLAAGGCEVVPESETADVRVLNSCTVTAQADATTRQRIGRLRRLDPGAHPLPTGCSGDANPGASPRNTSPAPSSRSTRTRGSARTGTCRFRAAAITCCARCIADIDARSTCA